MNSRLSLALRALGATIVGMLFLTGSAWAEEPATTAGSQLTCRAPLIEQPFTAFRDSRDYVLAPGGSFEDPSAPGWQLDGGASVVPESDPFDVHGFDDSYSLSLPPGASATSPTMCVDLDFPTMRFVGMQQAEKDGELDIEVVYPHATKVEDRRWHRERSFKFKRKDGWKVTDDVNLHPDRGGKDAGWRLVALRFTADGDQSSWLVDDVYVDPKRR
jgi:hypothetical protein